MRSHRPWYFQWLVFALLVLSGYLIAYWQFAAGGEDIAARLRQALFDNQSLQTKVIQVERQLQIEQAAQHNLDKELNIVQDENIHLKEELLFYKSMVSSKKRSK